MIYVFELLLSVHYFIFNQIFSFRQPPNKKKERKVNVGSGFISFEDFEALRGKEARLLHLYNVKVSEDNDGLSEFSSMALKKIPKINWVSDHVRARVLMPDGKFTEGIAEVAVKSLEVGDVIQFERFGFVRFEGVVDLGSESGDSGSVGGGTGDSGLGGSGSGLGGGGGSKGGKIYSFWFAHK